MDTMDDTAAWPSDEDDREGSDHADRAERLAS